MKEEKEFRIIARKGEKVIEVENGFTNREEAEVELDNYFDAYPGYELEVVSDSYFRDYFGYDLKVEDSKVKAVKEEKGVYRVSIYSPEQPKEEKVVVLCASLEGVAKAVCAKAATMYGFYFCIIVESLVADSNDLLVVAPGCSRRIVFSKSMNSADILKFL